MNCMSLGSKHCFIVTVIVIVIIIAIKKITRIKASFQYKALHFPDSKVYGANMGPPGADRTQVGPMLAPWTLLSELIQVKISELSNNGNTVNMIKHNTYVRHTQETQKRCAVLKPGHNM